MQGEPGQPLVDRGRLRLDGRHGAAARVGQRLLLEYDDERSGTFEPLRGVPDDKVVVLGLVTTKSGALERQEALLARIDEAARHFPREQLALSPQCGFGTSIVGNNLTIAEQNAKLRLVAETAQLAWTIGAILLFRRCPMWYNWGVTFGSGAERNEEGTQWLC